MQTQLKVSVSRSWIFAGGSTIAVIALVVGLWIGIGLGSPGQTSVVAASFDSASHASSEMATEGYGLGKVKGAACSSVVLD